MNERNFEEDISISYLRAVAVKAEVVFELVHRDTESKDVQLSKVVLNDSGQPFESIIFAQLKATCSSTTITEDADYFYYDLKAKNYNDLCGQSSNTKILALLILPHDKEDWVSQNVNELTIKKCMYWVSFQGELPTDNTTTKRVAIPKTNVLDCDALLNIMSVEANGGIL